MHKIKTILSIGMIACICIVLAVYTSAENVGTTLDFENSDELGTALYNNAHIDWETEDNGNHYINLSYNGQANRGRTYCDVKVADFVSGDKLVQAEYDMMCYETDVTVKNNEIQFKYRTGPGSAETTLLARLAQVGSYLQVQYGDTYERVKGIDNNYLQIETNRWYSVKLAVDLLNHKQNLYIYDGETQELLAYKENYGTVTEELDYINMVTFSTSTQMALDNVKISTPINDGLYLYGDPYIAKGETVKYKAFGICLYAEMTALPHKSVVWSIDTPKEGVSVNAQTGMVTVDNNAEPGQIVLTAQDEESGIRGQKIINISD